MEMVGHHHEFVKLEQSAITIAKQSVQEKSCSPLRTKDRRSLPGHRRDEECAISECIHATAAKAASRSVFEVARLEAVRFHGASNLILSLKGSVEM